MPQFLIERDWPNASQLSQSEWRVMTLQSCEVISNMPIKIDWIKSYVTNNKLYCLYDAPDEDALLEHASYAGFPANKISMVTQIIEPGEKSQL